MIRLAKAFVFLATLAVGGAGAALSIIGATSANAQSATSCPGGSDPNASDCLQINQNGVQVSLIEINEQDEIDNPGKMWMIGGLVETNPLLLGQWLAVIEPGTGAISDVVGIPTSGTIAFVSDAADFSGFTIFARDVETSSPIDVSDLLSSGARADGFTVSFQSDFEAAVPEPSTWAMMALGFVGLAFAGWRRAAKREAALA
jgi:hypothetical protein